NIVEEAESATLKNESLAEDQEKENAATETIESASAEEKNKEPLDIPTEGKTSASEAKSTTASLAEEDKIGSAMSLDELAEMDKEKRKALNRAVREVLKETIHAKEGTILHRPKITETDLEQGQILTQKV